MGSNRRLFIKEAATLAAGLAVAPGLADAYPAAKKIGVALIGCNSMGWYDLMDILQHPGTECLALCDVDKNVLDTKLAELEKKGIKKPRLFSDYRQMLKMKAIDAVVIGTPDHWHCLQAVAALEAGKHVYVEKPLANSIAECNATVQAAGKHKRIVTVGQQQRSGNHWKEMISYLHSGTLGKISTVRVWANFNYGSGDAPVPDSVVPDGVDYDLWLGPAPQRPFNKQRFHGSWRMFWDYGGGLMTDWGVHLIDMALWGMNMKDYPKRVFSYGGKFKFPKNSSETADTQTVVYEYPDYLMTWEQHGGIETGPYNRNYGLAFVGTNGTLIADRDNWEVIPEKDDGKDRIERRMMKNDGKDHINHTNNFIECIKSGKQQTACTIQNAGLCAVYTHLGNIAYRTGSVLEYDPAAVSFKSNPEADKFIRPHYRKPWVLPG